MTPDWLEMLIFIGKFVSGLAIGTLLVYLWLWMESIEIRNKYKP